MVVGFDIVNEEDYNMPISDFLEQILIAREEIGPEKLQFYFHAGESNSRKNQELYDAILMDSKRLGHAFALIRHPKLIEMVKQKGICVECCPCSNMALGYMYDLRTHPARYLLAQGVDVTISPDDPGFFDATGVTLDYVYVYLAWGLNLRDMKQLCLNSIKHSSTDDEHKKQL